MSNCRVTVPGFSTSCIVKSKVFETGWQCEKREHRLCSRPQFFVSCTLDLHDPISVLSTAFTLWLRALSIFLILSFLLSYNMVKIKVIFFQFLSFSAHRNWLQGSNSSSSPERLLFNLKANKRRSTPSCNFSWGQSESKVNWNHIKKCGCGYGAMKCFKMVQPE